MILWLFWQWQSNQINASRPLESKIFSKFVTDFQAKKNTWNGFFEQNIITAKEKWLENRKKMVIKSKAFTVVFGFISLEFPSISMQRTSKRERNRAISTSWELFIWFVCLFRFSNSVFASGNSDSKRNNTYIHTHTHARLCSIPLEVWQLNSVRSRQSLIKKVREKWEKISFPI